MGVTSRQALFQQICYVWQEGQVAGPLDGSRHFALVLQGVSSDATWQNFALLIDKLHQKVCILVVDVLNAKFAETAVFFAHAPNVGVAEKFYIVS